MTALRRGVGSASHSRSYVPYRYGVIDSNSARRFDALVRVAHPGAGAALAHGRLAGGEGAGQLGVAEPAPLQLPELVIADLASARPRSPARRAERSANWREKPRVDPGQLVQVSVGPAPVERLEQRPEAPVLASSVAAAGRPRRRRGRRRCRTVRLDRPISSDRHAFHEGFLEGPAMAMTPHRLHLRREGALRFGELLEVQRGILTTT